MTSVPTLEPVDPAAAPPPGSTSDHRADVGSRVVAGAGRVAPFVVLGLVGMILIQIATAPITNTDTFFHLRFGEEFRSGAWSLSHPGTPSTFGTAHWVPTQWLPEVVMAQLYRWFGLAGVAWFGGLCFLALTFTLFLVARRFASPAVAVAVTVVTLTACAPGMSIRPQQISYVLAAVTTLCWVRAAERRRAPWPLVPLTWVWAMSHGMWPTGLVIAAAAITGMTLDRTLTRRESLTMAAVPTASLLVCFLTPAGPGLLRAVLLVNSRGRYYSEWAAPSFTQYYCLALLLLIAVAVVPRLRQGNVTWFAILVIGLACGWGVYSLRTVPLAACVLVPFVASGAQSLLRPARRTARSERLGLVAGLAVALGVLALAAPGTRAATQPAWEDEALGSLPSGTVVLDESGYGGYLMWRFPNLDLVIHGYGDAYTDRQFHNIVTIERVQPHWDQLVRATGAQYAVVDPTSALGYALEHVEHWTVLHHSAHLDMLEAPPG